MKHALPVFVLAAACLAFSGAAAEDMSGNVQFLVGPRYLSDSWKPFDSPPAFGVEVDFAPASSPVRVSLGGSIAAQSKAVSAPYYGNTGEVRTAFMDFSAGFLWHPVKKGIVRPYLGAGVLMMFAGIGTDWDTFDSGDGDSSFGYYANGGLYFKVGDSFNIGMDGRVVRGTSIAIAGVEQNANYGQGSLLLGFSWGK